MTYAQTIGNIRYTFGSLRELLAKASPLRSGDVLAGVAAQSAEERVAAQFALADLPLERFLSDDVVPYEDDEVTRLIADTHASEAFGPIRNVTWQPRPGRTDAERNCISNIRHEGLSYGEGARQLMHCLGAARRYRLTGTALSAAQSLLPPDTNAGELR